MPRWCGQTQGVAGSRVGLRGFATLTAVRACRAVLELRHSVRMTPSLTLIVAYSDNRAIGRDNALPWRLPGIWRISSAARWAIPSSWGARPGIRWGGRCRARQHRRQPQSGFRAGRRHRGGVAGSGAQAAAMSPRPSSSAARRSMRRPCRWRAACWPPRCMPRSRATPSSRCCRPSNGRKARASGSRPRTATNTTSDLRTRLSGRASGADPQEAPALRMKRHSAGASEYATLKRTQGVSASSASK